MSEALPTIVIILLTAALMLLIVRRLRAGTTFSLRPLQGYAMVGEEIGRAIESGKQLHVTLGRAPLPGANGPTSVAALTALAHLARESGASGVSPKVTMGEATLLPAALGEVKRAHDALAVPVDNEADDVQFIAATDFPMAYAAGVTSTLHHDSVSGNVALGRFGPEIAIVAEAARREEFNQIIGSDDPTAMALATLYTENALWGEEIFATGAYLEGRTEQVASLRAQDLLRWLVAGSVLLFTLLRIGRVL